MSNPTSQLLRECRNCWRGTRQGSKNCISSSICRIKSLQIQKKNNEHLKEELRNLNDTLSTLVIKIQPQAKAKPDSTAKKEGKLIDIKMSRRSSSKIRWRKQPLSRRKMNRWRRGWKCSRRRIYSSCRTSCGKNKRSSKIYIKIWRCTRGWERLRWIRISIEKKNRLSSRSKLFLKKSFTSKRRTWTKRKLRSSNRRASSFNSSKCRPSKTSPNLNKKYTKYPKKLIISFSKKTNSSRKL